MNHKYLIMWERMGLHDEWCYSLEHAIIVMNNVKKNYKVDAKIFELVDVTPVKKEPEQLQ